MFRMRVLVCMLAALAVTVAFQPVSFISEQEPQERVIGGQNSSLNAFPHMVAVISDTVTFCGGSLISQTHVITAAHCVKDKNNSHVILGTLEPLNPDSVGYTYMSVLSTVVHWGYDTATKDNDIAILTLGSNAPVGDNIKPILLPRGNTNLAGITGQLSGWGKVSDDDNYVSNILKDAEVPIVDNAMCLADYGPNYINDKKVCVDTYDGTVGACYGDSGSPLIITDENGDTIQVGVMSFGASVGCTKGYTTVYTRVASYLQWIQDHGGPAIRP